MTENNTTPGNSIELPTDAPTEAPKLTELHQLCEIKLAEKQVHLDNWAKRYEVAQNKLDQIEEIIRDLIAGSMDPSVVIEENQAIIDILEIETTRTVDITIEVSWEGTIELPYGVELDDIELDDFDISCGEHPEYPSNINYYFSDSSIKEN